MYDRLRYKGIWLLLLIALGAVIFFIIYSTQMTRELAKQEKERMELWAQATREIISPDINAVAFPLEVIEKNTNIPVVLTDTNGEVLFFRNISASDSSALENKISEIIKTGKKIEISIDKAEAQYIYYKDSTLLQKLTFYPWILFSIILVFIIIIAVAVITSSKMEQNRLWIGLTKETAHQLGTPLSSLNGWIDYLNDNNGNSTALVEMKKDVERLTHITSRFSKVGTKPVLSLCDVHEVVSKAAAYMTRRFSSKVNINLLPATSDTKAYISEPLLQWVIENLLRNGVDAMKGEGTITISVNGTDKDIAIRIADTGSGIERKLWKRIFRPGYTTKEHGWGLGLTLSKRIVEQYQRGKIEISESIKQKGTTFLIILPRNIRT